MFNITLYWYSFISTQRKISQQLAKKKYLEKAFQKTPNSEK